MTELQRIQSPPVYQSSSCMHIIKCFKIYINSVGVLHHSSGEQFSFRFHVYIYTYNYLKVLLGLCSVGFFPSAGGRPCLLVGFVRVLDKTQVLKLDWAGQFDRVYHASLRSPDQEEATNLVAANPVHSSQFRSKQLNLRYANTVQSNAKPSICFFFFLFFVITGKMMGCIYC